MESQRQLQLKFILLGESGVGKTSILLRLSEGGISLNAPPTMGIECFCHALLVDGQPVRLLLWDTAGQERFYALARQYIRGSLGALLVFDITDRDSFDRLAKWLRDVRVEADPQCVVVLVGNKADLAERREVSAAEAEQFATLHDITYVETSAVDGTNIDRAFVKATSDLVKKIRARDITSMQLPEQEQKKGGCCG
jgi:small GTP-binding protein